MKDIREFRNSIMLLRRVQAGFESGDFGSDVVRSADPKLYQDIKDFLDQVVVPPVRCPADATGGGDRCELDAGHEGIHRSKT